MAFVVTNNCVKCKYTDCVQVCPVDCFYEGENMLVINPDECIDCGACEAECPASAIYEESELPATLQIYTSINAVYSGARVLDMVDTGGWPQALIAGATAWPYLGRGTWRDPLPGAEACENEPNKLGAVSPKPGRGS